MLNRRCPRKAAWLAFALVAFAALSASAQDTIHNAVVEVPEPSPTTIPVDTTSEQKPLNVEQTTSAPPPSDNDQAAEATRAYKQALSTLTILTAQPPLHTQDPSFASNPHANSILSYFLPNLQGQGPLGSAFRILVKLHQQSWITGLTSGFAKEGLGLGSKRKDEDLRGKAIKVIDLLQHSAELGNTDALYTLAQLYMFPPSPYFDADPKQAYESYSAHASATGNASSQAVLGFFHSTGYHGVVPEDQAKALLYYTFAASGGHKGAQMALGYRYWSGIGALEDCNRAMEWYEQAAEHSMAKFLSGPPGGRTLTHTVTRLSDLEGGVYGPGASVASTGINAVRPSIKAGAARAAGETWEDVLEYYLFNADRGETDFAYRLGRIFYQGSIYASPGGIASGSEGVGAIPRDYTRARHYFLRIARLIWPRDPPNPAQYVPAPVKEDGREGVGYASASAAYLGRMYLRGEGVKADPAMAKMWFERGAEYGDKECHNGLGIIYRDGLVGGKSDTKKAILHFVAAAGQDLAEAQVNLGKHHYRRGEYQIASKYLEAAMRNGSPFEAYYYIGEIQASQVRAKTAPPHIKSSSCAMAVSFYKLVAERGVWDDDPSREAEISWLAGTEKDKEIAILKWWIAAERGSEVAQNNLAYVLDQDRSLLRLTRFSPFTPSNETAKLALTQWIRSAGQRNIDALVKVGDYYYHGLGVSEDEPSRLKKAAEYYQSAADTQLSALAMWNLGWMYENGVGVVQDFHLAKRHYDLALDANPEAYLPVFLSLGKLYMKSIWHTLMGGKGGLNIWSLEEEEVIGSPVSGSGEGRELPDGGRQRGSDQSSVEGVPEERIEEDDGPWYLGKAREEFSRRRRHGGGRQGDEDDPIQWARERRNDRDRDGEFGPDDYYDGGVRRGDDDDELGETVLLVLLCLTVSVLLYVRTRLMDQMRREQQPQQQQQQPQQQPQQQGHPPNGGPAAPPRGNGLFPPLGDPARDEWAIAR
ncbi:ERAD-associated protein [Pleurotus pulmonarius]|nr:ERAD-associated protein [Pleurotus pulmonarius]KAF4599906.1 ERAD-associated protein [Pleurotus pulmonarius]